MNKFFMQEKTRPLCLLCACAVITSVQTCLNKTTFCPLRAECVRGNLEVASIECAGKSQIKILNLEENGFDEIGESVLAEITNLEELRLGYNQIRILPEKLFDNLTRLRELYLYNNEIQSINNRIFNATTNLIILSLQYNKISQIPAMAFKNLKYLSNLSLEANGIKKINQNAFPRENSLYRLYCFNNSISDVQFLEPLIHLNYLDLSENQIQFVPPGIFLNFTNLSELFWNGNKIYDLAFLENIQGLRHLELERNQISTTPIDLFNKLKKLEFLSLAYNKIEEIRTGSFSELKKLENLDLSHNLLVMFGEVLAPLSQIRFLQINDNLLESLAITDAGNVTISVENNMWKCEFVKNLLSHKQITLKYSYNASVSHLSGLPCKDSYVVSVEENNNNNNNTTPSAQEASISVDVVLFVLLGTCLLFIVGLIAGGMLKICSLRKKREENSELALKNVSRSDGGYMTPVPACQNIYEEIHDIISIRQSDSCMETIHSTI